MIDLPARTHPIAPRLPKDLWLTRALTLSTGLGLQFLGFYAAVATFGAWNTVGLYAIGSLAIALQHLVLRRATCSAGGLIVFVGLWLLLADVAAVRRAKMMGNPWLIHTIVIGSGLLIHGGSAEGAVAAIVSGVFSALYVRYHQRFYGYIRNNQWHPGVLRVRDPRQGLKS